MRSEPNWYQIGNRTCYILKVSKFYVEKGYLNFEPSFKLRWCRAQDLFGSQISVTTGDFELRISCIRHSYLAH